MLVGGQTKNTRVWYTDLCPVERPLGLGLEILYSSYLGARQALIGVRGRPPLQILDVRWIACSVNFGSFQRRPIYVIAI